MTSIAKPTVAHPGLRRNALGLTRRDYEGAMSTLCAGCGHDSVTAAIVQAFWELSVEPHRVAKLSGIGCSSKTPTYFLRDAHGFNSVHGRMPSIAAGAAAANRQLTLIGISGDGDSLSIGVGQLVHAVRRDVDMLYVLENNGVYGLTKGQFSASADVGTRSKKGDVNREGPIDPVLLALSLGATFVARSFSGDKAQLVPLIQAGLAHKGFALLDVISPCVTFNDHEGSTKSYLHTRRNLAEAVRADFDAAEAPGAGEVPDELHGVEPGDLVPLRTEITTEYRDGTVREVRMHDGSVVRLRKVDPGYDPADRAEAFRYLEERRAAGEVVTGLLYLESSGDDFHARNATVDAPLASLEYGALCPGAGPLDDLMDSYR